MFNGKDKLYIIDFVIFWMPLFTVIKRFDLKKFSLIFKYWGWKLSKPARICSIFQSLQYVVVPATNGYNNLVRDALLRCRICDWIPSHRASTLSRCKRISAHREQACRIFDIKTYQHGRPPLKRRARWALLDALRVARCLACCQACRTSHCVARCAPRIAFQADIRKRTPIVSGNRILYA